MVYNCNGSNMSRSVIIAPDNSLFSKTSDLGSNRHLACQVTFMQLASTSTKMAYGLRKSLPKSVLKTVNSGMLKVWESGILNRVDLKYKPRAPKCHDFANTAYQQASFRYVYLAFLLLGLGYGLALFICMSEMAVKSMDG